MSEDREELRCPDCKSLNTEILLDEGTSSDEDGIIANVECDDCGNIWKLPEELNWMDYT